MVTHIILVTRSAQDRLFYNDHQPQDSLREIRHFLKTSLSGMKTMLATLFAMHKSFVTSVPGAGSALGNQILGDDEIDILKHFVAWTLECVYSISERHSSSKDLFMESVLKTTETEMNYRKVRRSSSLTDSDHPTINSASSLESSTTQIQINSSQDFEQDIKTFLEQLMNIFMILSQASLIRTILSYNLDYLMQLTQTKPIFVSLIHYLLMVNPTKCSQMTMDCVINFVVTHLPMISNEEECPQQAKSLSSPFSSSSLPSSSTYASAILRLLKVAVGVISANPDNERVLRTKLKTLFLTSFRLARESRTTINFIHLFRTLFRAFTGGKFEQSSREIGTILPEIISGFDMLLQRNSHNLTTKCAIYELYLTIPCRLETLFPHFIRLLEIFVEAIHEKSIESLLSLALRTMEQWIENLNHDYLFSLMQSRPGLASKIFHGLCLHLKPSPYPYGSLAIRILGKFGGKNRLFFRDQFTTAVSTSELPYLVSDEHFQPPIEQFHLEFPISGTLDQPENPKMKLAIDPSLRGACSVLETLLPYSSAVMTEILSLHIPLCYAFDSNPTPQESNLSIPKSLREDLNLLTGLGEKFPDSLAPLTAEELSKQLVEESNYSIQTLFSDQLQAAYDVITTAISSGLPRIPNLVMSSSQLSIDHSEIKTDREGFLHSMTEPMIWKELFHGLLCAGCYPYLRMMTQKYLVGLCYHISLLSIVHEDPPLPTAISTSSLVSCLYDAILFACRSHRWDLYSVGIWTLQQWIQTLNDPSIKYEFKDQICSDVLSPLFYSAQSSCCDGLSWNERMSGVRVIYQLSKLLSPSSLKLYEATFLQSLFGVIGYTQPNRYTMVLENVFQALESLLSAIYTCPDVSSNRLNLVVDQHVIQFLFRSLLDSRVLIRIASQFSLHILAKELYHGQIVELFMKNNMRDDITHCLITSSTQISAAVATNDHLTNIGYISRIKFLSYHLISTNSLLPISDIFNYMKLLFQYYDDTLFNGNIGMNSLLKTEEIKNNSTLNPILFEFCRSENYDVIFLLIPINISEKIEIILQIISLIYAVVQNYSDLMNEKYITFRIECFQFLYNCLLYLNWEDIIISCGNVMYEIIQRHHQYYQHIHITTSPSTNINTNTNTIITTQDTIHHHANPNFDPIGIFNLSEKIKIFLTLFDHPRHMTLDKLKKLEVLLRLCKNRNYIKVGYKLLEHLKFWVEPDKVIQLNIWPAGEEIYVAAAMMNIFSILPWHAPSPSPSPSIPSPLSVVENQHNAHVMNNEDQSNQMHLIPFIRRYVEILVKLNRVLCQYRSFSSPKSPYMMPLSRFISTYTNDWITYFTDPLTLAKNEVCI
jgi:hypothetical protein